MFWHGTTVETGLVPPEKGCCGGTGWAKAITSWRAGGCCQKMVARVEKQRKAICQVLTADKKKHLVLPWQQTDLLGVNEQYSQVNSEVHRFLVWHIFNLLNSFVPVDRFQQQITRPPPQVLLYLILIGHGFSFTMTHHLHLVIPWSCSLETSHNTHTPKKNIYFKCFKSVHLSKSVDKDLDLVTKENAVTSYWPQHQWIFPTACVLCLLRYMKLLTDKASQLLGC